MSNATAIPYHVAGPNSSDTIMTVLAVSEEPSGFWVNSRDVPIIVGAVAGIFGLVILISGSIVIWHCCQFAMTRDKSLYSLDNESERGSVSSLGSNAFNSDSVTFVGAKNCESEANNNTNMKRSVSEPSNSITQLQPGDENNTNQVKSHKSPPVKSEDAYAYSNMSPSVDETIAQPNGDGEEKKIGRMHLYTPQDEDISSLRTRSLPWNHCKVNSTEEERNSTDNVKISFSKKRKNRMRNDSAAAIALNKSGVGTVKMPFLHKDTDSLVDNEAVVVYDERTAL